MDAGRGSRLGPLTNERPKCLVVLAGRSFLQWQLDALAAASVLPVTVVTGYQAAAIEALGVTTRHYPDWSRTNMVGTLLSAAPLFRRTPQLVSYSDIVYHPDHVRALAAARAQIAITYDRAWLELWSLRFENPLSDAETFAVAGDRLTAIGAKAVSMDEVRGQYMGLLRFTPEGFRIVEEAVRALPAEAAARLDMTAMLRLLLEQGVEIGAVAVDGRWVEVDSPADIERYERVLARNSGRWVHDWRW
ncbi:MAG: phosphocholine cytidylyltransferase family protein [Burkholderiales bacterium]|nr:phosphocholine cytidylyltransferase family protein [Burkholderiales bacterium]